MTLVNADTGEIVAELTPDEARRMTDRIKVGIEAVWELVIECYQRQAHKALGYSSWDDYCVREFGTARLKLPREERPEVVGSLREAGLSIRAIAAATKSSVNTVQKDLASQVSQIDTPATPQVTPQWKPGHEPKPEPKEDDVPPTITGTDGKTYKAKADKPGPRLHRTNHADAFERSMNTLTGLVLGLEKIPADFGLDAERAAAADGDLTRAIRVLTRLRNQIKENR